MAPSAPAGTVDFYTAVEYGGDKHSYNVGDDITFHWPEDLNDKFKSCVVGSATKVLAWENSDSSGVYKELTGAVPSLTQMKGLSRFTVIEDTTGIIAFRFDDTLSTDKKKWTLQLNAASVGKIMLYSNSREDKDDADGFRLVGTMPQDGPPVTTAIYVRNAASGVYIGTGSIYFKWNNDSGEVDIVENDNFPAVLKAERQSGNNFIMKLIKDH